VYEREFGPLGPERGDWQAALVAHTVATMLSSGKGSRPRITDFLLRWAPRRRQTAEEQLNIFRALASQTTKD
jgi:hypothetical protein